MKKVEISDACSFESLPDDGVCCVIHFAGALPAYMSGYDPRAYVQSNVMGTLNVLEYAKKCLLKKLFIRKLFLIMTAILENRPNS